MKNAVDRYGNDDLRFTSKLTYDKISLISITIYTAISEDNYMLSFYIGRNEDVASEGSNRWTLRAIFGIGILHKNFFGVNVRFVKSKQYTVKHIAIAKKYLTLGDVKWK